MAIINFSWYRGYAAHFHGNGFAAPLRWSIAPILSNKFAVYLCLKDTFFKKYILLLEEGSSML